MTLFLPHEFPTTLSYYAHRSRNKPHYGHNPLFNWTLWNSLTNAASPFGHVTNLSVQCCVSFVSSLSPVSSSFVNPSSLHLISPWAFWAPLPATLTSSYYSAVTTQPKGVSWSCLSLSNCTKLLPSQSTAGYNTSHLIFLVWAGPSRAVQAGLILEMKRFLFSTDCRDNCQEAKEASSFSPLSLHSSFLTCMAQARPLSISEHQILIGQECRLWQVSKKAAWAESLKSDLPSVFKS